MLKSAQKAATSFDSIRNQIIPARLNNTPKDNALAGETSPLGIGLDEVLLISGSISLSYHILTAFAPPAVRYPPTKTIPIVSPVDRPIESPNKS